jgi:lysophospholipase L1-like esterase
VQKYTPQRREHGRASNIFACLAGASLLLFALSSASAEDATCPSDKTEFEANGAALAFPKGGAGRPLDILAIGSSSTEGIGASSPANAYPARLEDELSKQGVHVEVKNAGIGGELAAKTLLRLKSALTSGWAQLVIWQVGTNDAIVGVNEALFRATVESGVAAARAAGVPLVLIDPQFTATSQDAARYERYVAIVDGVGAEARVPVLSRYAMMKRWAAKSADAVGALLSRDGLHMNDLGYRCLAHSLAAAIDGASVAAAAAAKL